MLAKIIYIFTQGLFLSWGPCLLFCGIYILPAAAYVTADKKSIYVNMIRFMSGRFIAYLFLGLLSGLIGVWLLDQKATEIVRLIFFLLILLIGLFIVFKNSGNLCMADKYLQKNFFILGLLVGFSPCLPLIGIMMQILVMSETIIHTLFLSLAFSIATVISPIWLMLWGVAELKEKLKKSRLQEILQKMIGLLLIVFALYNLLAL